VILRRSPLAREALLAAGGAALVAAMLAWAAPPGTDMAAHLYQRTLFIRHGFVFWNNLWYAGRYSFVTYSLLYYPLASVFGIRLLAVATIATAALAFAVVIGREWGPAARWSSRTFALVWAGIVLSAAFPFALGAALALLALWALQAGRTWRFACLALLTLAASPVAFLLLALLLLGIAAGRRIATGRALAVGGVLVTLAGGELMLSRLFPDGGRYPFSGAELAAALLFCGLGALFSWRVAAARVLRYVFVVFGLACIVAYLVPSEVGENIARFRYAGIPLAVLVLSLRRWRPLGLTVVALALAISWNVAPLLASLRDENAAANQSYWQPAISFLDRHLGPAYRVEAVDTVGHWPALYLPRAGIPLARGWFRQNDFPQNAVLYGKLGKSAYLDWLHRLAVRYVVRSDAPPDYSARAEARLLESGQSGLRPVFRSRHLTIYSVPAPEAILRGPGRPKVLTLGEDRIVFSVSRPGVYSVAVHWSPYLEVRTATIWRSPDGMIRLLVPRAGRYELHFDLGPDDALRALTGG
jgi:hypothetical protein